MVCLLIIVCSVCGLLRDVCFFVCASLVLHCLLSVLSVLYAVCCSSLIVRGLLLFVD